MESKIYSRVYLKPPLGIKPRFIHDEQRLHELSAVIQSRVQCNGYKIPIEWVEEYNELVESVKARKMMEEE